MSEGLNRITAEETAKPKKEIQSSASSVSSAVMRFSPGASNPDVRVLSFRSDARLPSGMTLTHFPACALSPFSPSS